MRYLETSPLFSLWVNERFYEKVINVKADVAALLSGWGSAQGIQQRPRQNRLPPNHAWPLCTRCARMHECFPIQG